MKIAPIFDPEKRRETPQAEQVDLHIIFLIGTIFWLILAIIFGSFFLIQGIYGDRFMICIWGIIIGVLGLIWELYNRHLYRLVALMQQ
ncbi:DUF2530 domain-containing protein [Alloscardovia theropitheci]|uniref:DUF2530 domain-containing protein n=1 Tax=Alloscardovia theropitheci TaxID=2496842 RepID=A0A4R0QPB7_9BIFI|nr:DUF2530 domain-containing protein [Alloscardovia theropitheci]TCD54072.1 DUF2530 domain-containing protein [Alloscardovia theropitheci]